MGHKTGTYLGGIRTAQDVRERCYVSPVSGCWHWRLHISRGRSCCAWTTADGESRSGTAARAAWELSGRRIKPGWVVSRDRDICGSPDCCNPEHHRAGPRNSVLPDLTPVQRMTQRIGTTIESRRRAKLSSAVAEQIRQSDASCVVEARKWGVCHSTISQIRRGETWRVGVFCL